MRVLMLSKACIVGIYQPKLEAIARRGVSPQSADAAVLAGRAGRPGCSSAGTPPVTDLRAIPIRLNGSFHLHHYPTLAREIAAFQPDIMHIDEEPYNLATWQALYLARRAGAKALFFTWQNIRRSLSAALQLGGGLGPAE